MAKSKTPSNPTRLGRPAISTEARESQMISLAEECAERQLRDGTASSQVIVHYLRLGSEREKLERERLREENKLLRAKAENLKSQKRSEELMEEALKAFRSYNGQGDQDPDEYEY